MWTPGAALVAPGPRVTKQTPGRPVALPTASAIIAAPPSWRQTVTVIGAVVQGVEHAQVALAGHAEDVFDAVDDQLVDQGLGGGAGLGLVEHGTGSGCGGQGPKITASVKARSLIRGSTGPR